MNARVFVLVALVFCVAVARAENVESEEEETTSLAGVETVEPSFIEESEAGFPFNLPKRLEKHTVEPRYYGESKSKQPKKYVTPEYQDPKPVDPRHLKHQPAVFTSHYFSPLPKQSHGRRLRAARNKHGRHLVPFRADVETPVGHKLARKGFQEAELHDGRLPNKFDDPRQNMKKTRAPAPQVSLIEAEAEAEAEVDTTEEMEADAAETAAVPPPFQSSEVEIEGQHAATVVADPAQFFNEQYSAPTWADEEATTEEAEAADMAAVEIAAETEEEALAHYNELDSFLQEAEAATQTFEEADESEESDEEADESEEEESDEAEDESEDEAEDESEEESEEESEDEAEDESEDESEEEESESAEVDESPVSLVEVTGDADVDADANDMELDEMEINERAAAQVDMDATSDEAAMTETDSDEDSSAAEADEEEEEIHEDAAIEEAAEYAENNEAAALVEEDGMTESVDTLLAEVDAHVHSESDVETESDTETESEDSVEVEAETGKGTPGSSILPGQTWEQMQNERLDAMEAQLEAEKATTPKVAAAVVSKEELNAQTENTQQPEYNSEAESVETVEPEILVQTAQTAQPVQTAQQVLIEKINQLKAIRRA